MTRSGAEDDRRRFFPRGNFEAREVKTAPGSKMKGRKKRLDLRRAITGFPFASSFGRSAENQLHPAQLTVLLNYLCTRVIIFPGGLHERRFTE
jgi:hypothetical protein